MELRITCQGSGCKNILKAEVKGISDQRKVIIAAHWRQVENVGMLCSECLQKLFQKVS